MKYAIKNKGKMVHAYRLGDDTPMERLLLQEGVIQKQSDGSYQLFPREAVHGAGEKALPGDYFKVETTEEGQHYAYPNAKAFFEAKHRLVDAGESLYEQKPLPLLIWQARDLMCPEIAELIRTERLRLDPADPAHYFQAQLWGTLLSTSESGTVIFYEVWHATDGSIEAVDFNLVTGEVFAADYTLCTADGTPLTDF